MESVVSLVYLQLQERGDGLHYDGHTPSFGGNLAVCIIFGLILAFQVMAGIYYKQWWFLNCWIIGTALECLGYAGRVWSSQNLSSFDAYVMQLVCITLGPCFLMAGIYYLLAELTVIMGQNFAILKPMQYSLIFIVSDAISILLQAAGGGIASAADTPQEQDNGAHLMVAGLAFQGVSMTVFQIFWYIFMYNIWKSYKQFGGKEFNPQYAYIREKKMFVPYIFAISIAVIFTYIRSWYRVAELSEGWDSYLTYNENYVMILEALMMLLACLSMSIFHPGFIYGKSTKFEIDKSLKNCFKSKNKDKNGEKHDTDKNNSLNTEEIELNEDGKEMRLNL